MAGFADRPSKVAFASGFRRHQVLKAVHITNRPLGHLLTDQVVHFEAHIDLCEDIKVSESQYIVDKIQFILKETFNINHTTLQLEFDRCDNKELIHQEGKIKHGK